MAFVSNSGYTAVAKRIVYPDSTNTSFPFAWMEIGSGSNAATDSVALQSAMANATTDSGLIRASMDVGTGTAADGRYIATSTGTDSVNGDTAWFRNTWTCKVTSIASGVKECGVFNSATNGDMLAYGTFPTAIPMGTGDTLQVTWSVQVKTGA